MTIGAPITPEQRYRGQHPGHHRGHGIDQAHGLVIAALAVVLVQDRHEGLRERAFGKNAAQQVGDAERHIEGVGHVRGAKGTGDQDFAHQAGDAREHRQAADGGKRFEQVQDENSGKREAGVRSAPGRQTGLRRSAGRKVAATPRFARLRLLMWRVLYGCSLADRP
jgi:hypothetical protein